MDFVRGMRDKLDKYVSTSSEFNLSMTVNGSAVYDYCCFGVDSNNKLSDDRYMVFYNQTSTPNSEVVYQANGNTCNFKINLSKLPIHINRLVFTVSIDGNGSMGQIANHNVTIGQNGNYAIQMNLSGSDFKNEKAIISVEIYRKDDWRIATVATGFDGGLSALLAYYGGEEVTQETTAVQPTPTPVVTPQPVPTPTPVVAPQPVPAPQPIVQPVQQPMPSPVIAPQPSPVNNGQATNSAPAPAAGKVSLKKGQKISLTKSSDRPIIVENGWRAQGKDYDLKALVRYRNGRTIYIGAANADEVLATPEGAVVHGGDVKVPGKLEYINISWHPDIASVAVSSYSAIENGTGSFSRYGVFVRITNGNQVIEIPAESTSADDRSYTLCFGEIIYGNQPNSFEVSALEMYSRPNSEHRIGYQGSQVMMDIGPIGRHK